MVLRLLLVCAALFGIWLALKWFSKTSPAKAKKALIAVGLGLLVAAGVALVVTGKLAGLFAVAAGLAPWVARAMRVHGLWRGFQRMTGQKPSAPPPPPDSSTVMTPAQAYEILGLAPGADEEAIKEAHRRLMRANHPDAGGSTWIAARLNQARDTLLG
ncbi:hypothetical protein CU669_19740 [Paramagnetospirillum kuznetsovii]|uniref:J domain-containing protein n=1 Tax=Paramagnetospirillum kuznetsovii TaxID=2053833 RepID=A0A364NSX7_9PROT|nr:DnaJ domain-containing protein [Paramagnetospirillum kuznetsovii]RAU20189.1 hypothetical protein CU669_19740 [Paramagnetospirillum kuznetsovii]